MVENIYKVNYSSGDAFFFEIDESVLILQKGDKDKVLLHLFDCIHNTKTKSVEITKENYEIFKYFQSLYNSFKLEEELNKQVTMDSLLKEHSVEYKSINNEGKTVSKLSMDMNDESITLNIDNYNEARDDFVVSTNSINSPLYRLYNNLVDNYCENHQVDFEEILYREKKRVRI